jgi:hypothetical protein
MVVPACDFWVVMPVAVLFLSNKCCAVLCCCLMWLRRYLIEPAVWPHAIVALVTFATMFGVLTELPGALAHAPYSLSAGLLGVSREWTRVENTCCQFRGYHAVGMCCWVCMWHSAAVLFWETAFCIVSLLSALSAVLAALSTTNRLLTMCLLDIVC